MNDLPISSYFDDDGTPINPNLIPRPKLCLSCKNNDDPYEEILCTLNRLDQRDEPEFECFAYQNRFTSERNS